MKILSESIDSEKEEAAFKTGYVNGFLECIQELMNTIDQKMSIKTAHHLESPSARVLKSKAKLLQARRSRHKK